MWIGDTIYYNSDRDGHFNLYAYNISNGRTTQITTNRTWDLRWPSSDNENQIIYELSGELQVLDTSTKKSTPISINVPDEGNSRRPSRVSART
jgi:tricorn protease